MRLKDICQDAFQTAQFIVSIEETFDIEIHDDEFDRLVTVGDLVKYVKRRRP